jgi:hypothetical protein
MSYPEKTTRREHIEECQETFNVSRQSSVIQCHGHIYLTCWSLIHIILHPSPSTFLHIFPRHLDQQINDLVSEANECIFISLVFICPSVCDQVLVSLAVAIFMVLLWFQSPALFLNPREGGMVSLSLCLPQLAQYQCPYLHPVTTHFINEKYALQGQSLQ